MINTITRMSTTVPRPIYMVHRLPATTTLQSRARLTPSGHGPDEGRVHVPMLRAPTTPRLARCHMVVRGGRFGTHSAGQETISPDRHGNARGAHGRHRLNPGGREML